MQRHELRCKENWVTGIPRGNLGLNPFCSVLRHSLDLRVGGSNSSGRAKCFIYLTRLKSDPVFNCDDLGVFKPPVAVLFALLLAASLPHLDPHRLL
jgi:hypothetical protein